MTQDTHSLDQAMAQLAHIEQLVSDVFSGGAAELEHLQDHPLEITVRSGWSAPGEMLTAAEYCILLCTGGPAVRIVGELDSMGEPTTAELEHQDWFTPWTRCQLNAVQAETLLTYAQYFYFGE